MKKVTRKKSLAECMVEPMRGHNPYACCLKLETDSILLIKLRSIFKVSSDKNLSVAICKHLWQFAQDKEQKDMEKRVEKLNGEKLNE